VPVDAHRKRTVVPDLSISNVTPEVSPMSGVDASDITTGVLPFIWSREDPTGEYQLITNGANGANFSLTENADVMLQNMQSIVVKLCAETEENVP